MNLYNKILLAVIVSFLFPSCARAISQERRDYILAHPHGWVELSFNDYQIPSIPVKEKKKTVFVKPEQCRVTVSIDDEPYFSESVYPFGETEPYRVESGFRFPAPVGPAALRLTYSGCDAGEQEESGSVEQAIEINVAEGIVHNLDFDGTSITAGEVSPNRAVTLEDIYDAVTGKTGAK
jgi:hypothetical protein